MLPGPDVPQPTGGSPPEATIRSELEKILASAIFSRSERLSRLLRFIVERTLEGQAATLKEQVLAGELYGRGSEFNASTDPVVRVDARRLRDKLREYYTEFQDSPLLITIPRGGYAPAFQPNPRLASQESVGVSPAPAPQGRRRTPTSLWRAVAVAVVVVVTLGLAIWWTLPRRQHSPPTLVPLTSTPGNEEWPALSPDGEFVAFVCPGSAGNPSQSADICLKAVSGEVVQRILETPAAESRPAWSPDGREIAFVRSTGGIFVVSRMGGAERRISDSGSGVAWTPDGKSILVRDRLQQDRGPFMIFQMDRETLARRQLTRPEFGAGEWSFTVSPDGQNLALIRYLRPGVSDLYVMPMAGGEPRRLTQWNSILRGPAWTPCGKEIVYATNDRLWRIPMTNAQPGRGSSLQDIPVPAGHVTVSHASAHPARLVFHSPQQQVTLRLVDLSATDAGGMFTKVESFVPSTRRDIPGPFSHDGSKVAFTSTRNSADHELWVAGIGGEQSRQLTSFGRNSLMLAHAWSPDDRRILFEGEVDGNTDLYVADDRGQMVRLTRDPTIDALASWSRDGRWIYYTKVASAMEPGIWRVPAGGGVSERVTSQHGSEPQESPDGRFLYYLDRPPLEGGSGHLMRSLLGSGEAATVLEGVVPFYWSVTDRGIYFVRQERQAHSVYLHPFHNGKTIRIGRLPFRLAYFPRGPGRLTVSRDGRTAMVSVVDRWEGDLMLLNNFR